MNSPRILDVYIAKNVITSISLVLLVLLALFLFVDFISELEQVGKGDYQISDAAKYVLLTLPTRIVEIMPITCLLGATIGLGILANGSELTAMRAAGMSILRIAFAVIKLGVVVLVFTFLLSEFVSPKTESWAQSVQAKTSARGDTLVSQRGFWTRDGSAFVKVETVLFRTLLSGLEIFHIKDNQLQTITRADFAVYNNENTWELQNVRRSSIGDDKVYADTSTSELWRTDLEPALLDSVSVKPERLPLWDLYHYVNYLSSNGQDAGEYALAFWRRIATTAVLLVMIVIAVPFVLGPMRSVAIGQRIVVATLLGIAFHVFDQTMSHLGLVYRLPPAVTAFIPALVFAGLSYWLMRSVR